MHMTGNTYGAIESWFVLDTIDRVHVPRQLVRLLVYDLLVRLCQTRAKKKGHTGLGDDGAGLLKGGALISVQNTDCWVWDDQVVGSVEPSVVFVEWLQRSPVSV